MSPPEKPEPTYAELVALRQQEWETNQAQAAAKLSALHAKLADMPDVRGAPSPDLPWSHHAVHCLGCASKDFWVTRWVTVNGVRYRAELQCGACARVETWDWCLMAWIR